MIYDVTNNWLLLALASPLFWTISDFIDKYTLETHTVGIFDYLFTFSLTSWFCFILIILMFGVPTFSYNSLIAMSLGFSTTASFYFFAKGLKDIDTSLAILTFKLIPILAILFSFILFKNKIYLKEIIASLIVILGSIYTFTGKTNTDNTKNKGILWVILSVVIWSVIFVIADNLLKNMSFIEYMTFDTFGASIITIPLYFHSISRKEIKLGIQSAQKGKYFWFFQNTFFDFLAQVCIKKSLSLAPSIGLVTVVAQIQSIYGIIAGIALTYTLPNIFNEDISFKTLLKKTIGIIIMVSGIILAVI